MGEDQYIRKWEKKRPPNSWDRWQAIVRHSEEEVKHRLEVSGQAEADPEDTLRDRFPLLPVRPPPSDTEVSEDVRSRLERWFPPDVAPDQRLWGNKAKGK
jgi:hypothetical protein